MAGKTEQPKAADFDALDLQIIAIKKDRPNSTIREIAELTESTSTTIWRRLQKIGDSDWIKDARNECLALLPVAIAVYAKRMHGADADALAAARDLLYGLGVLKRKTEISGPDGEPLKPLVVILPDNGREIPDGG